MPVQFKRGFINWLLIEGGGGEGDSTYTQSAEIVTGTTGVLI